MDENVEECNQEVCLENDTEGMHISFNITCINIILYLVHIYSIEVHMYKYFCNQLYDINIYFQCVISSLFHIFIYTTLG